MGSTIVVPGPAELLSTWERGLPQPPVERALTLLAAARPGTATEALAGMPVGVRDEHLFRLRSALFGSRLVAIAACPDCGEPVELSIDIPSVLDLAIGAPSFDDVMRVGLDGYEIAFRHPATADLMGLEQAASLAAARQLLLERCVSSATQGGAPVAIGDLPEAVIDAIATEMGARDPLADVSLSSVCPDCDRAWDATLDIAGFLWRELHAWARRTLRDIHVLASGYGWREAEILALSPVRRQAYLELLQNE